MSIALYTFLLLCGTAAAYGCGSLLLRDAIRDAAVRATLGLAILGTLFGLLGMAGLLRPLVVAAIAIPLAIYGGWASRPPAPGVPPGAVAIGAVVALPLLLLAAYPPTAFDETTYHLPTVKRFAATGALPFIPELRAPVFPHLAEVLQTAFFFFGGDTATHLAALLATLLAALIACSWGRWWRDERTGWIAAALVLSSPMLLHYGTTGYVDAPLMLFIAGAVYAFARWDAGGERAWLLVSASLAGAAAAVKYLALPWLAALFLAALLRARTRRWHVALLFAAAASAIALPWYARIAWHTGNPFFPLLSGWFGETIWGTDNVWALTRPGPAKLVTGFLRLPLDMILNAPLNTPRVAPWILISIPILIAGAIRERGVRILCAASVAWCVVFQWLPRDGRYLALILPLIAVATALSFRAGKYALVIAVIAVLPGMVHAWRSIDRRGLPPVTPEGRAAYLRRTVPEYGAIAYLNRTADRSHAVWVCGGEQLPGVYDGTMFGDHGGIARYDRFVTARSATDLAARLRRLQVHYLLLIPSKCTIPALSAPDAARRFEPLYRDDRTMVFALRD